jgi:PPP family 3-phenylpropionic acid transporter
MQVHRYGLVRLWGSVSFIVAVVGAGHVVRSRRASPRLPQLLLALLVLIAAGALADPRARVRGATHARRAGAARSSSARAPLVAFLAASFLLQFSHAPYYGFFSLYLEQHGYTRAATGLMWSLGVVAEIGVFACAHRLLARFGLRAILLASLLLAALRWLMIGFGVDTPGVVAGGAVSARGRASAASMLRGSSCSADHFGAGATGAVDRHCTRR